MDGVPAGLTAQEAKARLEKFGENTLEVVKQSAWKRIAKYLVGPIPLMLIAAAVLSFVSGKAPDGVIILALFFVNIGVQMWHEHKADAATATLQAHLTSYVKTRRDGQWQDVASRELVPGDVIELSVGSVVPADIIIRDARNLTINESTVTGESLPKEKRVGESAYAGSFVSTGRALAEVQKTGGATYFGEALSSASAVKKRSVLETDILSIARYLSISSVIAIIVLTGILLATHSPFLDVITLDLSLLIAGIPVALPTVMSLIISVGVVELARKQAVVRRLSALEDFANVTLLLSDKTGTLTENALHVGTVSTFGQFTHDQALALALACAASDKTNPIDAAIVAYAGKGSAQLDVADFIPGDSERKRSTAYVKEEDGVHAVALGAPPTVRKLCDLSEEEGKRFDDLIGSAASRGDRMLALAKGGAHETHMQLVALIPLSDTLRADVPEVLKFLGEHGVGVKMLTGDSYEIAVDVAKTLGFKGEILRRDVFDDHERLTRTFASTAGYAEMLPKDKLIAVQEAKKHAVIAVTGDGVNDVPAVKAADVGIAVRNAVDALRGTADIVLLTNGLGIIGDAIIEARKVFLRLYHYSVFSISESFRVVVTILIIGLIFKTYPLTPVELILIAFMNDIPVVSIAFDRVRVSSAPSSINVRGRFVLSSLLGLAGVGNSLFMLWIAYSYLHLPWNLIQTVFFLKLVVSGHLMIYVAHTEERWWRFLPSKQVIAATLATQLLATGLSVFGIFVPAISWQLALFIWVWSFFWMQVSELAKYFAQRAQGSVLNEIHNELSVLAPKESAR